MHDEVWLQEKMRTTQKQLDDLTRQVNSLLSEKSQLETRTRILEQVVYLNTNHEQRLHANQAGCWPLGGLCLLSNCSCLVVAGQQHDYCNFSLCLVTQHAEQAGRFYKFAIVVPYLSMLPSRDLYASH